MLNHADAMTLTSGDLPASEVAPPSPVPADAPWRARATPVLRYAAYVYLAALPLGHLWEAQIYGASANLSDVLLLVLLGVAGAELLRLGVRNMGAGVIELRRGVQVFHLAAVLLCFFALYVALGSAWAADPTYAQLKGGAYFAMALGAVAILWSGAEFGKAADAWLVGLVLALAVLWIPVLVGPEAWAESMVYQGGGVHGLPFPRPRGPFPHPNMFGDYLMVSGALLWARWPDRPGARRWASMVGGGVLLFTLALMTTSAWVGVGVLLIALGLSQMRQRGGGPLRFKRPQPVAISLAGVVLVVGSFWGLVAPLDLSTPAFSITTDGLRPAIWVSTLETVREAPFTGVGATPALASVPAVGEVGSPLRMWDAHNVYLSLLGQFGLVGFGLLMTALGLLVMELFRQVSSRGHMALAAAVIAVAVHGMFVASEDFRHLWAFIGLIGLAGIPAGPPSRETAEGSGG